MLPAVLARGDELKAMSSSASTTLPNIWAELCLCACAWGNVGALVGFLGGWGGVEGLGYTCIQRSVHRCGQKDRKRRRSVKTGLQPAPHRTPGARPHGASVKVCSPATPVSSATLAMQP